MLAAGDEEGSVSLLASDGTVEESVAGVVGMDVVVLSEAVVGCVVGDVSGVGDVTDVVVEGCVVVGVSVVVGIFSVVVGTVVVVVGTGGRST